MKTGKRDELKLVTHQRKLFLKLRDRMVVKLLLPVERRRTVVRQQLAWILLVNRMRKTRGVFKVRFRSLAPDHVGVRRIGEPARDCLVQSRLDGEETFGSTTTS